MLFVQVKEILPYCFVRIIDPSFFRVQDESDECQGQRGG